MKLKITDLLKPEAIALGAEVIEKEAAIDKMIVLMRNNGNIADETRYRQEVWEREAEKGTGVGEGIAIPHAKTSAVTYPGISAMVLSNSLDFASYDNIPVDLIFLIAAPDTKENIHLDVLSTLARLLLDVTFVDSLRAAGTKEEFIRLIDEAEQSYEIKADTQKGAKRHDIKILAVTSCPNGISHTYLAAESLEKEGAKLGISIKVETNGAAGCTNMLTRDEIAGCEGIIIAADRSVEMERFDGRPVLMASASQGIFKPRELIQKIVNHEVGIYRHMGMKNDEEVCNGEGWGRKGYKCLMNGVSHMLPFVVSGGVLLALALLLDDYSINPGNFGRNTLLAAFFTTVGEQAFRFMLPVLSAYIAVGVAERPALVAGFVGGALASKGYTFYNLVNEPVREAVASGFLGVLLAGFTSGFVMLLLAKAFRKLPSALNGIKSGLLLPILGVLLTGGIVIAFNPVVSGINNNLNEFLFSLNGYNKILLSALVAGMMAVDMGGPVNKAAYVFATVQLASPSSGGGQFEIMAAVMAGGMVPPFITAICSTFFKNRFTENGRKAGFVNYIMGFSFITEGAIPFVAADPFHVLPPCILGSAIAGGLSTAFGCKLMVPLGGFFVISLVANPELYFLAIAAGSIVGALLLGLLKKPLAY